MGIVNRRNALVGWFVLRHRKWVVREIARALPVPAPRTRGLAAGALAGIVGALVFWRNTRGSGE